jgi:hypothetical protein
LNGKRSNSCRFCFPPNKKKYQCGARKLESVNNLRVEGEIDRAEYELSKQEIELEMREAQKWLQNAPADVKDLEGLLSKVDRIAEIIQAGSPERKKVSFLSYARDSVYG